MYLYEYHTVMIPVDIYPFCKHCVFLERCGGFKQHEYTIAKCEKARKKVINKIRKRIRKQYKKLAKEINELPHIKTNSGYIIQTNEKKEPFSEVI